MTVYIQRQAPKGAKSGDVWIKPLSRWERFKQFWSVRLSVPRWILWLNVILTTAAFLTSLLGV